MVKKILMAVLALGGLTACQTTKPHTPVEAMQMPPKPAGTARIVLFRSDSKSGLGAPAPVITVNGEIIGTMDDETLYIRDVAPGPPEVSLAVRDSERRDDMVIDPPVLRASLNAGGEWYIQTVVTKPCKAGTKPVDYSGVPTGSAAGNAVLSGLSLMSTAVAYATMTCITNYRPLPVWPQSTWHLNPLLAKQGAKPTEPVAERILPQAGLSWRAVESAIRDHFTARNDDYKLQLEKDGQVNLMLQGVDPLDDRSGSDHDAGIVVVRLGYLQIDETTIAGQRRERSVRYTLRREGAELVVADWQPAD